MPIKNLPTLGPIFGLTEAQADYALELVYHGARGAWIAPHDPMMPLMRTLLESRASLSEVQIFAVLHTMLAKACDDWEAPTLTGQPSTFAQTAFAALKFEVYGGAPG